MLNLILVFFNLSYIPLRDIYLRQFPSVVEFYDPVKGIEPHPDTTQYIQTVDTLATEIQKAGLEANSTREILASLRQQSHELLVENPFSDSNQFGTFSQLKRRIEYHLKTPSAQQAFDRFWSPEYLTQTGWLEASSFFDQKIRPLLEVNYLREIDENGQYLDNFWKIDLYFIIFLGIEFLGRTFVISLRQPGINWFDAMLRRWYDGFLFIPIWRWLRIIPVSVRLHKSGLIHLDRILAQVTHEPAAYLADRVSTFLMVRLINQAQTSVETGEVARSLLEPEPYLKVSQIDKIDAISDRLLQLKIYRVLPQIKPELEDLLRYSMRGSVQNYDLYQGLQQLPVLEGVPSEVIDQLADYIAEASCDVLASSSSDLEGRELFNKLSERFKKAIRKELQDPKTQAELQGWLSDFLEELKLNYLQHSEQQDPEITLGEAEQLRQTVESSDRDETRL